jgi:hypothetical protein
VRMAACTPATHTHTGRQERWRRNVAIKCDTHAACTVCGLVSDPQNVVIKHRHFGHFITNTRGQAYTGDAQSTPSVYSDIFLLTFLQCPCSANRKPVSYTHTRAQPADARAHACSYVNVGVNSGRRRLCSSS